MNAHAHTHAHTPVDNLVFVEKLQPQHHTGRIKAAERGWYEGTGSPGKVGGSQKTPTSSTPPPQSPATPGVGRQGARLTQHGAPRTHHCGCAASGPRQPSTPSQSIHAPVSGNSQTGSPEKGVPRWSQLPRSASHTSGWAGQRGGGVVREGSSSLPLTPVIP